MSDVDPSRRRVELRLAAITGWKACRWHGLSAPWPHETCGFVADLNLNPDGTICLHFEVCGPSDRLQFGVDNVHREVARLAALGIVHGGLVP